MIFGKRKSLKYHEKNTQQSLPAERKKPRPLKSTLGIYKGKMIHGKGLDNLMSSTSKYKMKGVKSALDSFNNPNMSQEQT